MAMLYRRERRRDKNRCGFGTCPETV